MDKLSVVGISGSLRRESLNTRLLNNVIEMAADTMKIEQLDWSMLPIYNGDLEADGLPQLVLDLQHRLRAADGVIIVTPEYNHGVPGPLKNMIDWMSRGPSPHGFYNVPVAICGASDGVMGTTRSQAMLRQTLAALNAPTLPFPQVLVGKAQERFDDNSKLVHEPTIKFIGQWLEKSDAWFRRFPRSER